MNKKVSLLVLHGLVVGLLSAWQLPHCLSCIFFLEGLCHPCQEKSLCAWNQTERQCRTLFFCFLTQDPLRRNSLFNLPLIFFNIFLVSARVSWREGGDGGGREEGWTSLSGSDHYGHQGNNGDQRMWLQSRLSFTFCSLPPLLHGQSRK